MAPFLAVFFLFFSLNAQIPCDRAFTKTDQDLYKTILLSAKDSKTKLRYLERFGKCINTQGVSIFSVNGIPVAERLECGNFKKKSGMELFFKDSVLCGRSVEFFPSRKVFLINGAVEKISLSGEWKFVEGEREFLIYDSKASFKEGQDANDRILKKDNNGSYTNSIGKMMHPSFIFENGKWTSVTPLRELFYLKVEPDGNFEIEIVTESAMPYSSKKLTDAIGLKAETVKTSTPAPSRYFIKGAKLKAIRMPSLNGKAGKNGFNGKYSFKFDFPGIKNIVSKTFSKKNFEIKVLMDGSALSVDVTVRSTTLTEDEIREIRSIMDSLIPLYHAKGKDGKK